MSFSVAINAFNRENEIAETLDSVLGQSLPPAEVVVVDDGSQDGTASIVSGYAPHVRLVRIANVGQGMSRDLAIRECSSEWVATCDSDDLWSSDHLANLDQARRAVQTPVLVFANSRRCGSAESVNGDYNHFAMAPKDWWEKSSHANGDDLLRMSDDLYSKLLTYNPVYPSTAAMRRDVYLRIGANPAISRNPTEDFDITSRLSREGNVVGVKAISVAMRKHDGNVSARFARNLLGCVQILDAHLRLLDLSGTIEEEVVRARDERLIRALDNACWEEDFAAVRVCLARIPISSISWRTRARLLRTYFAEFTQKRSHVDPVPEWLTSVAQS